MPKDRREYNAIYYQQNRERLNELAKARYHKNKKIKATKKIALESPQNDVSQN